MVAAAILKPEFIVAEISKTYVNGVAVSNSGPVCGMFEIVINTNYRRGYELDSWKFLQTVTNNSGECHFLETVLAVFRLIEPRKAEPCKPI